MPTTTERKKGAADPNLGLPVDVPSFVKKWEPPAADQVQAESPAPVINLPWTITAHECNARATTPQTGSIIGRIALECRDGQKAWAFAEQRTRAYEENRARFKKIADDFKSSEAMKGYLNLRAKLSEVEEKITTEETAALKLAPEVQNAIRAAENPGPLRGKLERHKQEVLRLKEWARDLGPEVQAEKVRVENLLGELLDAATLATITESTKRREEAKKELAAFVGNKLTALEVIDNLLWGLKPEKVRRAYGLIE